MFVLLAAGGVARADQRLIVAFRGEGPNALERCAEALDRSGAPFASATADGSGSIDALRARHRVKRIRALLRGHTPRPLEARRAALRARVAARAGSRPGGRAGGRADPRVDGRAEAGAGRGAARAPEIADLAHVYVVEAASDASLADVIADFGGDPHVAWAQADHANRLDGAPAPDPFLSSAGSWGQPYADAWAFERVRAREAWSITRGEGVVVAVVDTGLDYGHPDIAANVWVNPGEDLDGNGRVDPSDHNGVDDDDNGFVDDLRGFDFANSIDADDDGAYDGPDDVQDADPFDDVGHGTHVAGTIAAVADNGLGIAGVAPEAEIMALKGFPESGPAPDSVLWRAVVYAIENGADVVNNSWSCSPPCPENPLGEAVARLAREAGVVIVTSAGNRQTDVIDNAPENGADVITVAATGEDDDLSRSISNFGWMIDVSAPGGGPSSVPGVRVARRNILSLRSAAIPDDDPFVVGDDYYRWAGTSMASPHVAGAAALLLASRPGSTVRDVRRLLRRSALDLGAPGHDRTFGAGRLDAFAAVSQPPLPDLEVELLAPAQRARIGAGRERVPFVGTVSGRDLVDWTLSVGLGNVPATWTVVASGGPAPRVAERLGDWAVADAAPGTRVVRLRATATDGSVYDEYRLLSVERTGSRALTPPGPDAGGAVLDGGFVVFEAARDPDRPDARADSRNVFLARLATGEVRALAAGPADEHSPALSDGVAAWIEADAAAGTSRVVGCALGPSGDACRPFATPSGDGVTTAPASAAGFVIWAEGTAAGFSDLRACRPRPADASCEPVDLGLEPAPRGFPRSDGDTLAWVAGGGAQRHLACRLDRRSGHCDPRGPAQAIRAVSRPASSGDLFAWVGFSPSGLDPLIVCRLDRKTGECPEILVDTFVEDTTPRLSGRRLVWERAVGDEADDVFFCEFDERLGACPVQRLTAELSVQSQADVDGRRVVWSDAREGGAQIRTTALPRLDPLPDRRVRVGDRLRVAVRATDGGGDGVPPEQRSIALGVVAHGDASAEALGLRILPRPSWPGRARGVLAWRPGEEHVGLHWVTVSGTTASGLVTRRTVRIEVAPRPPAHPPRRPRPPPFDAWSFWRWLFRA